MRVTQYWSADSMRRSSSSEGRRSLLDRRVPIRICKAVFEFRGFRLRGAVTDGAGIVALPPTAHLPPSQRPP